MVVVVVLFGFFGLLIWLVTPRLSRDFSQLINDVPTAFDHLENQLKQYSWGQSLLQWLPPLQLASPNGQLFAQFTGTLSTTLNALTNIIFILFIGFFLAGDPQKYYAGLLHLVPSTRRERLRRVLDELIATLRWWLLGQLFSMVVIGTLTGIGLWLLGMPFALAIGVVAGLLEFIPYVGPILTGALAGLFALLISPWEALYVILLYIGIQQFEGNILIPLVHQYTVALLPALTLTAFLIVWSLFGFTGLLVATPLVAVVLVKMFYIEDVLHGSPDLPRKMLRSRPASG